MEYLIVFLKGILAGIAFGAPVGAVGLLTIRRTLEYDFPRGLSTGAAGSVSDTCYALLASLGISLATDFLEQYQLPIRLCGSLLLIGYGVFLIFRRKDPKPIPEKFVHEDQVATRSLLLSCVRCFFTALPFALLNPAAIVLFSTGLVTLGITDVDAPGGLLLGCGVLLGSMAWWVFLLAFVDRLRARFDSYRRLLNLIFGSILILLALILFFTALN